MNCSECTIDGVISCLKAAEKGHIECMKYARLKRKPWSQLVDVGLPKKNRVYATEIAAKFGHLDCLRYAHENGCRWIARLLEVAAENSQFECFKYAYENGCCLPKTNICVIAATNGCLDLLKYANEKCFISLSKSVCEVAAKGGHLDCLKYAHEKGCKWDENVCNLAVIKNRLDCFRYAYENGCPWSIETCDAAAIYNSIDCLKYAHEKGCPWDEHTIYLAVYHNNVDCVIYAYENGCPWDDEKCTPDLLSEEIVNYLDIVQQSRSSKNFLPQEQIQKYKNCVCCICFDNISQVKFLPCEHKICCKNCSIQIIKPYNQCPICRSKINHREALTIEDLQQMELKQTEEGSAND